MVCTNKIATQAETVLAVCPVLSLNAAGCGGAVSSVGLDVALAAPVRVPDGVAVGGGVAPGEAVKLGLRLSAGQAGDRDVVTEVR